MIKKVKLNNYNNFEKKQHRVKKGEKEGRKKNK